MATTDGRLELGEAAELGAIGCDGVRVWVRAPGASEVTGTLSVDGREPVIATAAVSADSDWTGVLIARLPEPAPGAPFCCRVGDRELRGELSPTIGAPAALSLGFGSCNMPFAPGEGGAIETRGDAFYAAMRADLERRGAALLLLVGDQIYADGPVLSVLDLEGGGDILERYRAIYRLFFAHPGYRALRERFSTLCTWDDHEIVNDWGALREPTDEERRLFPAACRAFCEYQHGRNPGGGPGDPPYHFTGAHGDIGFLALDTRGARDAAAGSMLGDAQWRAVQDYLAGPDSRAISTLVVLASVPIAHVSRWFTAIFDRFPERFASAVRDRWCSAQFVASRDALLDALFAWQRARPRRQVLLVSGDVHAASAFSIRERGGEGVIHQVTSSAMTTPLDARQVRMNRLVVRAPNLLERRYRFRRHFLSVSHNFGAARFQPLPGGGHRIDVTVRAWQPDAGAFETGGELAFYPADATEATRAASAGESS